MKNFYAVLVNNKKEIFMNKKLPQTIESYVKAKNAHDISAALSCFSETATVLDEGKTIHGTHEIKSWLEETSKKYKVHLEPISIVENNKEKILRAEVSGTFDGSPIDLDFHFIIENEKIEKLHITI